MAVDWGADCCLTFKVQIALARLTECVKLDSVPSPKTETSSDNMGSVKEVTLLKANKPWKRGRSLAEDATEEKGHIIIEGMKKMTRGILNKLTAKTFDKLVKTFLDIKFEETVGDMGEGNPRKLTAVEVETMTAERLGPIICIIYEKAIDEPKFTALYAKMVYRVHIEASRITSKIFRKKILDRCQLEFLNYGNSNEEVKLLEKELMDCAEDDRVLIKLDIQGKKDAARRRSIGNVVFVGELYKQKLLTERIMISCIQILLSNGDNESLERVCKLLTSVGEQLEKNIIQQAEIFKGSRARQRACQSVPDPDFLVNVFQKIERLCDDKKITPRIRFALLDLFELRNVRNWEARRVANEFDIQSEVRSTAAMPKLPPGAKGRKRNKIPKEKNVSQGEHACTQLDAKNDGPCLSSDREHESQFQIDAGHNSETPTSSLAEENEENLPEEFRGKSKSELVEIILLLRAQIHAQNVSLTDQNQRKLRAFAKSNHEQQQNVK